MDKMVFEQGVLRVTGKPAGRLVKGSKVIGLPNLDRFKDIANGKLFRVCIKRSLGGIGDVLMATPALRAIKYHWPNCHLTFATDFKYIDGALRDILLFNPYIDELISHHTVGAKEYDFVTDITSCCVMTERQNRKPPNRIDIFAEHIGVSLSESGTLPDYIVSVDEQKWAKEKLSKYPLRTQNTKRIGIQVRSSTLTRSWPLENVRELAIKLAAHDDIQVFIFDSVHGQGAQETWNINRLINVSNMSIRPTAALINEMDLIITPDSGLMHIAGALNKKIVALFAGTDPDARINYYPNAIAIARTDYKCHPCYYNASACNNQYTCMKSITIDEVYNTAISHLQGIYHPVVLPISNKTSAVSVVRETGGLGDIVCLEAALGALKHEQPEAKINLYIPKEYHPVFENNPYVSYVGLCNEKKQPGRYINLSTIDATKEVRNLQTNLTPMPRKVIYARALGVQNIDNIKSELFLNETELSWGMKMFADIRDKGYKIVATLLESAETYRNWSLNSYRQLFTKSYQEGNKLCFAIVDYKRLRESFGPNVLDTSGFQLRDMFALIQASDIVLSPDSSAVHIAAALNKPCVALYGPIDWHVRCYGYNQTTVISSKRDCVPCWRNEKIPCKHQLPNNVSKCLTDITPDQVLKGILSAI